MLSVDDIREAGRAIRQQYGSDLQGLCQDVNDDFGNHLHDYGLPIERDVYDIVEVRIGEQGEELHYVCGVDGCHIMGYPDDSTVYIDAALTQFSTENREEGRIDAAVAPRSDIPDVVVAGEDSKWRSVYKSPDNVPGAKITPNTLTNSHQQTFTELVNRIIKQENNNVGETFTISSRITMSVIGKEQPKRGEVTIRIDRSSLPQRHIPETPQYAEDPLRGLHDDICEALDSIPVGSSCLEWVDRDLYGGVLVFEGVLSVE